MNAAQRARFLVVESNACAAKELAALIAAHGHTAVSTPTREGAVFHIETRPSWAGFFLGLTLHDGSGLEILSRVRSSHPYCPAIVLAASAEPAAINATFDLGASYVVLPLVPARIERFLSEATSFSARLEPVALAWQRRYGLSDAERDVLLRAGLGASRDAIAAARGCSRLTVKKHGANLLQKTLDDSLHGAVERLLREAAGA